MGVCGCKEEAAASSSVADQADHTEVIAETGSKTQLAPAAPSAEKVSQEEEEEEDEEVEDRPTLAPTSSGTASPALTATADAPKEDGKTAAEREKEAKRKLAWREHRIKAQGQPHEVMK